MIMRIQLIGFLFLLAGTLTAQLDITNTQREALANTITVDELKEHLTILASDEMEGRETGQPGQKLAAAYLAGQFEALGLPAIGTDGSYYQPINFARATWTNIQWEVAGRELKHLRDFYSIPRQNETRATVETDEILFLGYGIDDAAYSDYARADEMEGRTILILGGEPTDRQGNSLITGSKEASEWATDHKRKLEIAAQKGIETVVIVQPGFRENMAQARKEILNNRLQIIGSDEANQQLANAVFISSETARGLIGKSYRDVVKARKKIARNGKLKPVTIPLKSKLTQEKSTNVLAGENVLGFVAGSDPERKDEVVIVTAHYDHIGRRGSAIYNGADDNGSGTSTVLEVAEAFAEAQASGAGPKRSVLFMLVSGEEKGLLGSQYYVKNPLFPLEQTVANVNVDMVGRVDEAHADDPYYIYVIGSDRLSTDLHQINEEANATYTQLELDYTYNAEDDPNRYYYRSDHYNFAREGIPAIFYFNGTHEDYHRDTDTVDKINFEKMERIGKLVFHTVWELANREERIRVDKK